MDHSNFRGGKGKCAYDELQKNASRVVQSIHNHDKIAGIQAPCRNASSCFQEVETRVRLWIENKKGGQEASCPRMNKVCHRDFHRARMAPAKSKGLSYSG